MYKCPSTHGLAHAAGAKAIYILDFDGSTLDAFAQELEQKHKGLKVRRSSGPAGPVIPLILSIPRPGFDR